MGRFAIRTTLTLREARVALSEELADWIEKRASRFALRGQLAHDRLTCCVSRERSDSVFIDAVLSEDADGRARLEGTIAPDPGMALQAALASVGLALAGLLVGLMPLLLATLPWLLLFVVTTWNRIGALRRLRAKLRGFSVPPISRSRTLKALPDPEPSALEMSGSPYRARPERARIAPLPGTELWASFRHRSIASRLAMTSLALSIALGAWGTSSWFTGLWVGSHALGAVHLLWPCPRCGQSFALSMEKPLSPLSRECAHCGASIERDARDFTHRRSADSKRARRAADRRSPRAASLRART